MVFLGNHKFHGNTYHILVENAFAKRNIVAIGSLIGAGFLLKFLSPFYVNSKVTSQKFDQMQPR